MQVSNFQKGLIGVLLLLLLCGGTLLVNRIIYADAFNREEAQHAIYGLWLYKDLRGLDWGSFWYDTQRQMFWPFLHSWVLAAFYLLFGVSYFSSRFLSLSIFFATLLLMYLVSFRFSDKWGGKIGLVAVLLALSSPMCVRYATENTLEGLGALIFLASFYFYAICEERKLFYKYLILGLLVGLSIYTHYLYAYLMIPALAVVTLVKLGPLVVEAIHLSREGEKAAVPFLWWAYKKLLVLGVLLFLIAVWFMTSAFSRKIMLLFQVIFRHSGADQNLGLWNSIIYYFKAMVQNYAFSPWLGILIVLSLFTPFVAANYRQVSKLFTLVWTVILLATLTVPTRAPQIIYIIAPFIFLIFSSALFYWVERIKRYAVVFLLIVLIPAALSLPALGKLYFPPCPEESMLQVLDYFRSGISPQAPIASSINLQRLNSEGVAFHFWDWKAKVLTDPIVGEDEMFREARYFLTVELEPSSPYQSEILDDSIYRWNSFLADKLRQGELREYSFRSFPSLGLTAKIYEK